MGRRPEGRLGGGVAKTVAVGLSAYEVDAVRLYACHAKISVSEVFRGAVGFGPDLWIADDVVVDGVTVCAVLRWPTRVEALEAKRGKPPGGWVAETAERLAVVCVAVVDRSQDPWLTVTHGGRDGDPAPLFRFQSQALDWLGWQRALGRWP